MNSFKLDMNTLNCVLLVGILVLVIMYYMNKSNEDYAGRVPGDPGPVFDPTQGEIWSGPGLNPRGCELVFSGREECN